MKDNVEKFDSKVDLVDAQVRALDYKIDLVIKFNFEFKYITPSILDREKQLNTLIPLCLKHTMEESEQRYYELIKHHEETL